jgi:micrococcal nuclease
MEAVFKPVHRAVYRFTLVCLVFALAVSSACSETGQQVYVGKSGQKYHKFDCPTLRNTKREMSLAAALNAGYTPCAVCKPEAAAQAAADDGLRPYRVNTGNVSSYKNVDLEKMLRGKITRHVDGDTVHVTLENPPAGFNRIEKIRMIGVDTPETVHPSKDVEYFGREASAFTKEALLGKDVFIALDWDTRDKYGRLLAYIYTADGRCHNAALIEEGFAHAYTRFPFQFLEEFRLLERKARESKAGLWTGQPR